MKDISIIVAISQNYAIGFENKLLYWLPNDLKRFKALTTGNTIIMGRKTFESLPKGALPNRRNIVLSSNRQIELEGAEVFSSLEDAIRHCKTDEKIFIIGGASVYKEAIKIADKMNITLIEDTPKLSDAYFPQIDGKIWKETGREAHHTDEKHPYPYVFIDYERR